MHQITDLLNLLKDLEDQLTVCMRCGMCQAVCPLFGETGRESDVARGKLALLDGLARKMIVDPGGVNDRLNRCLLCGSCAANCPSGVNILEIFLKARAIMAGYLGLPPAKKVILRGMLAHPGFFDRMAEWGARFQKIFTRPVNDLIGTSCARFVSPLLDERHIVPPAKVPFHRMVPNLHTRPGKSGIRVAVYVGCLLDKLFPKVAQAMVKALEYHEVGIFMPANQGCCGIPAVSSGDTKAFFKLMNHNLDLFDPRQVNYDYLLTACATCTSTIKKIWPMMAGPNTGADRDKVAQIADKTMDISRFLVSVMGVRPVEKPEAGAGAVTYHDPCHLKKSLNVFSEPRDLIRANPGYRLCEMAESDWCCGMGGSFNLFHYKLSASIGDRKRDNIMASNTQAVATGCPACMVQISDALSKAGASVAVKHAIELYAEGL